MLYKVKPLFSSSLLFFRHSSGRFCRQSYLYMHFCNEINKLHVFFQKKVIIYSRLYIFYSRLNNNIKNWMGVASNRKQNHWLSWSPEDNGLIVIIDISFKTARPLKKKKNSGCPKKKKTKKKHWGLPFLWSNIGVISHPPSQLPFIHKIQ